MLIKLTTCPIVGETATKDNNRQLVQLQHINCTYK